MTLYKIQFATKIVSPNVLKIFCQHTDGNNYIMTRPNQYTPLQKSKHCMSMNNHFYNPEQSKIEFLFLIKILIKKPVLHQSFNLNCFISFN